MNPSKLPRPKGPRPTTGKFATRGELVEAVLMYSKVQGDAQVARTCRISPTTVRNILRKRQ